VKDVAQRLALSVAFMLSTAPQIHGETLRDLYFGEALYKAYQGHYFSALERLDTELGQFYGLDEPSLDPLHYHLGDAEFSVGDFELRYRMHHRAGRAITAVLESEVDEIVRNEAAYRLARVHFQKGQLPEALEALARIEGKVPANIRGDIEFLRANTYLAMGNAKAAIETLKPLQGSDDLQGFVAYNLGIALLEAERFDEARQQLDRAGQLKGNQPGALAIRDKANLTLGTMLLQSGNYIEAGQYLDRVRLDGPFSNTALLGAGWAALSAEDYERATVPWGILAQRDATDPATQEALLALPFAFAKLHVHGRAAEHYGLALSSFGNELEKIDASIQSIRDGRFLKALAREEIRHDKDWVIRLRTLPQTPETYYLMQLMASHDFQTGLQNYLDLHELRSKLAAWLVSFDAFEEMVSIRRLHYEPLLPDVDTSFRELDSRMRLRMEQQRLLEGRLNSMLTAPRPEFLATADERSMLLSIEALERRLADAGITADNESLRRLQRLKGRLLWILHTEYDQRLVVFYERLQELKQAIAVMQDQYEQFVRARQAATHSYQGYDQPIRRLRTQVQDALARVNLLTRRQGRLLEVVAVDELVARRQRLETYEEDARYALADSFDRATQLQAREAGQ
jgi:predicted negative regulator of RcsB-dependent stress response